MSTTRLNFTPNGLPHLGHLYLTLVNQHEAKTTGGRLVLIFDDSQPCWVQNPGTEAMASFASACIDDFAWMGIHFDDVIYQSQKRGWIMQELERLHYDGEPEHTEYPYAPICMGTSAPQYPWEDFLTVEKVLIDAVAGVDTVIRGEDLHGEYALYQSMWNKYITRHGGAKPPAHAYLPRLRAGDELDNVSKTNGSYKIKAYRDAGWKPETVKRLLAHACLKNSLGAWSVHNVKTQPILGAYMDISKHPIMPINTFPISIGWDRGTI